MSSAKRRRARYSPPIFKPLVSQVSHRNMLSRAAVNSLVSPCRTPLLMLTLLLFCVDGLLMSSCSCIFLSGVRCTHIQSPGLEARSVRLEIDCVEGFLVVDECDAEWDIIFSALILQLVYDVDLVCR